MALSSTSRPSIRGRVLSRLPATFNATGGLGVSKANGVWTLEPAWTGLDLETTIPDADARQLWVYDPVNEVYTRLSVRALIDNLPEGPEGPAGPAGIGSFRNLLVNPQMQVDQFNAGANYTVNHSTQFKLLDMWSGFGKNAAGVYTVARSTAAPPAGFTHFLRATVTASATPSGTDSYHLSTWVEGYNAAQLALGTADATSIALSFWARSSVTGQRGVIFTNAAGNRFYVASYAISAANTWEHKTITLTGDTSGTWVTNNGVGLQVSFNLGSGSAVLGATGAWGTTAYWGATNDVSTIATNGATFDITGVQIERGNQVTDFEFRPIGTEVALASRYLQKSAAYSTAVQAASDNTYSAVVNSTSIANGAYLIQISYPLGRMRASATVTTYPYTTPTNTGRCSNNGGTDFAAASCTVSTASDLAFLISNQSGGALTTTGELIIFGWWADARPTLT